MDVSISIASYNSCDVTRKVLEAIFLKTENIEYEVIVVDNASSDGSADMIERLFPTVRLIRSDKNLGFAAAHNKALSLARGNFLLLLNSDAIFPDNGAKKMVDRFSCEPTQVGVVGPKVLNSDGSLAPSSRRKIIYSRWMVALSTLNQLFPFGHLLPMRFARRYCGKTLGRIHDNFNPPAEIQEVEWVDGICVMFRRELLKQTGLFDEQFFFDMEIGDLLIRSRACGWHIIFDPGINIIHLGGYSRRINSRIMLESYRSTLIYYSKHRPAYVPMLRWLQLALFGIKILLLKIFNINKNRESLKILNETRKMIVNFRCDSVIKNTRIPQIDSREIESD